MKHIKSLLLATTFITTSALGVKLENYDDAQKENVVSWILPIEATNTVPKQDLYFMEYGDLSILNPLGDIKCKKHIEESNKVLFDIMENTQYDMMFRTLASHYLIINGKNFTEIKDHDMQQTHALDFLSMVASLEIPSEFPKIAYMPIDLAKLLLKDFTAPPEATSKNINIKAKRGSHYKLKSSSDKKENKPEEQPLTRKAFRVLEDSTSSDYNRLQSARHILHSSPDSTEKALAIKVLLDMVEKNTASNDKIRNARELINKYGNLNEIKVLDQIIEMREKNKKVQYHYQ